LNAEEPLWAPDGKTIYFSAVDHETEEAFAADVAAATVRRLTDKPGVLHLTALNAKTGTAVGTWSDPKHPDEVFRSDLRFTSIEALTNHNAWLADYALGDTEVIRWKSSKDGMEIDGIVTKPVDYDSFPQNSILAQSAWWADRNVAAFVLPRRAGHGRERLHGAAAELSRFRGPRRKIRASQPERLGQRRL